MAEKSVWDAHDHAHEQARQAPAAPAATTTPPRTAPAAAELQKLPGPRQPRADAATPPRRRPKRTRVTTCGAHDPVFVSTDPRLHTYPDDALRPVLATVCEKPGAARTPENPCCSVACVEAGGGAGVSAGGVWGTRPGPRQARQPGQTPPGAAATPPRRPRCSRTGRARSSGTVVRAPRT